MTQELNFTVWNNKISSSRLTLSQNYPENNGDYRLIQCRKMIQENHNIDKADINSMREFSRESDMTLSGILCYTDRMDYYNDYGLVLCNNDQQSVHVSVENRNQASNHLLEYCYTSIMDKL